MNHLISKYHVAAPRYTSYPTVPYWKTAGFTVKDWERAVAQSFRESNDKEGISIYIHLPFCESLCTYCGCNTRITKNHKVESPYIEALLKEWQLYLNLFVTKPLIKELHLGGGTPTFFSAENLKLMMEGILKYADLHEEAEFSFEAHPGNTTDEHLATLNELGFKRLSLGIQDFDPQVQLVINRVQTYEEVEQVTLKARALGYTSINYDLIYGLPHQKIEGLSNTLDSVLRLKPDRIAFYSYAHVPWVKPGQRRYTEQDLPSQKLKQQLYDLGYKRLREGGYLDVGMDHFTLVTDSLYDAERNGKLHRNFMGYTHQYSKLMIGLGVSSISDTWTAFAQNVKTVEEYLEIVNSGKLPVVKGHLLNAEDMQTRKHILNIMCKGHTSWTKEEAGSEDFSEGLQRMRWLAMDGLVFLSEDSLSVTPLGKRFLRNICMALDYRYWADQPKTELFSLT
ncbi:oxygen-independent coproporphyrinogen III oxidase [Pedobacter gandavensis]|uniref:oxygen-independent coproporphyrinogen III oxidase n=1 Tax=Pedobacter gandavensis TaxID=2679963 RepID=UPI002931F617|nr:oxygen-independent coproporphyrinogen III oxidase [Pedobacter gandavensis]